jgi:hypothetical protein
MEENEYQLIQQELEVHEVMKVHYEEGVFPSIYPCSKFMSNAGIMHDFQTLISNAGLEHFVNGEPHWWRGVDDVNDRSVGNPKRRCDEHSSKFSLSYETKV